MIAGSESEPLRQRKYAVLLLAHGTPETIEEIPEYLKNVVSGRAIPQSVVEEIQRRYAQIGKSPLTEWTFRQAELLEDRIGLPVYVGMRNWKPYIADTVGRMAADGVTDAVALCMTPQNSRTSVGLYRRAAYAAASDSVQFHFIDAWADHPRLADAFAARLRPVWIEASRRVGTNVPVVFTAHSVPCRTVLGQTTDAPAAVSQATEVTVPAAGPIRPTAPDRSYALPASASRDPDPYAVEAKQTAALVAERLRSDGLSRDNWYFAFQSQGASGGPWIGPTCEDTLRALQQEGHRGIILQPIGFLCDHVEILYDIDIAFQQLARKLEIALFRPESLNDSPLLIEALADLTTYGLAKLKADSPIAASPPA